MENNGNGKCLNSAMENNEETKLIRVYEEKCIKVNAFCLGFFH